MTVLPAVHKLCPSYRGYFSSSSFSKLFIASVTLKSLKSQLLLCRPQCDMDAGDGLGFLGGCGLEVGLDAVGDIAGSEVVRFGCDGIRVVLVVICAALGIVL